MKNEISLGALFLQNANIYRNMLEKKMNEIGLHYGQIAVLNLLWTSDGSSQIEIAAALNLSQPTVNKMVKSLMQNGFVESRDSLTDGRVKNIFLSTKAKNIEENVSEISASVEDEFFVKLTETEKLIFRQICEKLLVNS